MATFSDITVQRNGQVEVSESEMSLKAELKQYEEYELGRGFDCTTSLIASFQVVPIVSKDMIILTNEGCYSHSSIHTRKFSDASKFQHFASITVPLHILKAQMDMDIERYRSNGQNAYTCHEERYFRSIAFATNNPLTNEISKQPSKNLRDLLQFIIKNKTTHYVSKITLGAAVYCTIDEKAYSTFTNGKAGIGMEEIAKLVLSFSKQHQMSENISETYKIGEMDDKCSDDKHVGVVAYETEPILSLITNDEGLKKNLKTALNIYIKIQQCCSWMEWKESQLLEGWPTYSGTEETDGEVKIQVALTEMADLGWKPNPENENNLYAIFCNHERVKLFLDVDTSNQVLAQKEAKFIFHLNKCKDSNEFVISLNKHINSTTTTPNESRCLKIKTRFGVNDGPLYMEDNDDHCRLKLCRRKINDADSVNIMSDFKKGNEKFCYICTSRPRDEIIYVKGYLYLKPTADGTSYILACKSSKEGYNLDDLMLFSLMSYEQHLYEHAGAYMNTCTMPRNTI